MDKMLKVNSPTKSGVIVSPKSYIPQSPTPRQQVFLDLYNEHEVFYGGAAGGGKSSALLIDALKYIDVPDYAALLLRRTYQQLMKPGALIDRAHQWLTGTSAKWSGERKQWKFPSGATLTFGYLESEMDKYQYQSAEFQFIGFDELTHFTETQYLYMFSRLRRLAGSDVPIRMRSGSNPATVDQPGIFWVEKRFIPDDFDPDYESSQRPRPIEKTGFDEETGKPRKTYFVFARLEDNPHLDQEEYDQSLSVLDPVTRAQLRRGDWKIKPRGDIYWMFNSDYVFVPWSRFAKVFGISHIPDAWRCSIYQDQGTSDGHIGATGWFATASANSPIPDLVAWYRAYQCVKRSATEVGDAMLTMMGVRNEPQEQVNKDDGIMPDGFGGMGEFGRVVDLENSHEAESERLEYAKMGLGFISWTAGPNIGIAQVRRYLSIIDRDKPNPFFPEKLMGRTRLICVIPDEDYPMRRPKSVWARVEAEFIAYHYKKLKGGENYSKEVPDAKFNDFMDVLRECAFTYFPPVEPLTKEEEFESYVEKNYPKHTPEAIEQRATEEAPNAWARRVQIRQEWEEKQQPSRASDDYLDYINNLGGFDEWDS